MGVKNGEYFCFYRSFEEAFAYIPEDEQLKFYKAITRYGLYGEEPDLDGKDMAIFSQIKFAIDNQRTRNSVSVENGKKGGRKSALSEYDKEQIVIMHENGASIKEISEAFNCSERTIYGLLQNCKNLNDFVETKENLQEPTEIAKTKNAEKEKELENELGEGEGTERGAGETARDAPKGATAAIAAPTPPERRNAFKPPTLEEVRTYCAERHNGVSPERFTDFYASKGWLVGRNKMKDWRAAVRTWEQRGKSDGRYDTVWQKDNGAAEKYLDKF